MDQQPIQELREVQEDFLLAWPTLSWPAYAARLSGVYLAFLFTIGFPVSLGTFSMADEPVQVVASATIGSLFIVLITLLRLYIGWSHVGNRLLSATVEYEETGWYDGQTWVKTPQVLMRDRLEGMYVVKPTIGKVKTSLLGSAGLMAASVVVLASSPPAGAKYMVERAMPVSVPMTEMLDDDERMEQYENGEAPDL